MKVDGKDLFMRLIKIIDIFYINIIYIMSAFYVAYLLDNYVLFMDKNDEINIKNMSFIKYTFDFCFISGIMGVVTYTARNILENIPFPLDGLCGFDHQKVKELKSGAIFGAFLLLFSKTFQKRAQILRDKLQKI